MYIYPQSVLAVKFAPPCWRELATWPFIVIGGMCDMCIVVVCGGDCVIVIIGSASDCSRANLHCVSRRASRASDNSGANKKQSTPYKRQQRRM
jgi:hypothetical protein